jgi:hypothetical protein
MFSCSRLVDKATTDDDTPVPAILYAEAIQLIHSEPANAKRLISSAVKKLSSSHVIVRVKALQFLTYLCQNGPPVCASEIKTHASTISDTMGWRGKPHEKRGYEPYQEMKEAAQTLLDFSFTSGSGPTTSFALTTHDKSKLPRTTPISTMESYGNAKIMEDAPSLEPRTIDPVHGPETTSSKPSFFKRLFHKKTADPASSPDSRECGQLIPKEPESPISEPMSGPPELHPTTTIAPNRGQFDRLGGDVSWAKPKSTPAVPAKFIPTEETPTSRLLKITGNRALPTNGELNKYKECLTPDAADELRIGIGDADWKVRVRAVTGMECYGDKFGYGPLAHMKHAVEQLIGTPQSSLRTVAARVYEKMKNASPTAVPSAFDFLSCPACRDVVVECD